MAQLTCQVLQNQHFPVWFWAAPLIWQSSSSGKRSGSSKLSTMLKLSKKSSSIGRETQFLVRCCTTSHGALENAKRPDFVNPTESWFSTRLVVERLGCNMGNAVCQIDCRAIPRNLHPSIKVQMWFRLRIWGKSSFATVKIRFCGDRVAALLSLWPKEL